MKKYPKTYSVYMIKLTIKRNQKIEAVVTWHNKNLRSISSRAFDIKTQYDELCDMLAYLDINGYVQLFLEEEDI